MTIKIWLIFVVVAGVNIISPGPAVLLAINNGARYGARRALASSAGNAVGLFCLASSAMLGLGAIMRASAAMFFLMKLAGAAYLLYLGVKQFRSSANVFAEERRDDSPRQSPQRMFMSGFLLAATNPKPILFFTALFPQFIVPERALMPQFLVLTATFIAISMLSLSAYAIVGRSARRWFLREECVRLFNRVSGAIFVVLAGGMLSLKRASN